MKNILLITIVFIFTFTFISVNAFEGAKQFYRINLEKTHSYSEQTLLKYDNILGKLDQKKSLLIQKKIDLLIKVKGDKVNIKTKALLDYKCHHKGEYDKCSKFFRFFIFKENGKEYKLRLKDYKKLINYSDILDKQISTRALVKRGNNYYFVDSSYTLELLD